MGEYSSILQVSDIFWVIFFLIGALAFLRVVHFKWITPNLLMVFLLFKFVCCIGFSAWALTTDQDFDSGSHYLFGQEYANLFLRLIGGDSFEYLTATPFWSSQGSPTEHFRSLIGLISVLTGGSFMACALTICCMGATGQLLILKYLRLRFPEISAKYSFIVLLHPSLAFWSSLMAKDALGILALGLLIYHTDRFLVERRLINVVGVLAGVQLALGFRSFILVMFVVFLLTAVWDRVLSRIAGGFEGRRFLRFVYIYGSAVLAASVLIFFMKNYGADMVASQQETNSLYMTIEAGSNINNAELGLGVSGIAALPFGAVNSLLRPFPWEARKVNQALAALENLIVLIIVLRGWRAYLSHISDSARRHIRDVMFGFLIMTIICAAGVGLFSSNLGTISRYRIPLVPLFVAGPCIALGYADLERRASLRRPLILRGGGRQRTEPRPSV